MTKVLIAGCGDLGQAVATRLDSAVFDVFGLRRSRQSADGMTSLQADVTQPASLAILDDFHPAILLYCISADAQTDASYKAHYVDGLRNVLAALDHNYLRHVFFVSSTRVYGQQGGEPIDESVVPAPADFGGQRLLEGERLLEALDCGTTVLRLSGIYGPGRTRMLRLAREPQNWPTENHWTNRIHRDDAAAFIAFLMEKVAKGLSVEDSYIVTDSEPAPMHEVLGWLAGQLRVDIRGLPAPEVAGGKRLQNRCLQATGFKLGYPDYRTGYASLMVAGNNQSA